MAPSVRFMIIIIAILLSFSCFPVAIATTSDFSNLSTGSPTSAISATHEVHESFGNLKPTEGLNDGDRYLIKDKTSYDFYFDRFTIQIDRSVDTFKVNEVQITLPDMYYGNWFVIHGVHKVFSLPNPTEEKVGDSFEGILPVIEVVVPSIRDLESGSYLRKESHTRCLIKSLAECVHAWMISVLNG